MSIPRPGDPRAYGGILRPGASHAGGTVERARGRRLALDRMTADLEPGEVPQAARLRTPDDLRDATGTPVAMITVDVVDGEPRVYLVVPDAPGINPTVMRLRDDLEVELDLDFLKVVLTTRSPTAELALPAADVEDRRDANE